MTRRRRGLPTLADELLALGLGLATGLVTAYVARIWLSGETLPDGPRSPAPPERRAGPGPVAGGALDQGR